MVSMEELSALFRRRYLTPDPVQWRETLSGIGVVDVAMVALEDRYGAWGFLELWRTRASYSPVERATLAVLVPVISAGLRAAAARTFVDPTEEPPTESGVVLLDADLRVRSQTAAGAAVLLQLLPPDEPAPPVPAAAYNAGAALLAAEQGEGAWDFMARVHLGGNRWVVVRAARLGGEIAVSIAPATAAERIDLYARVHGMSRPETAEVLALAVLGLDSRAIAGELVIARTTAEDHLKALLAKTRVPSRQVLISRALGAQ